MPAIEGHKIFDTCILVVAIKSTPYCQNQLKNCNPDNQKKKAEKSASQKGDGNIIQSRSFQKYNWL